MEKGNFILKRGNNEVELSKQDVLNIQVALRTYFEDLALDDAELAFAYKSTLERIYDAY